MKKKKKNFCQTVTFVYRNGSQRFEAWKIFLNKKVVNFSMTLVIFNYWLIESIDSDQVTT